MTPAAPPTVRFAPSPTGRLHVGNVRAALVNWLFARRFGGRFLLRLDDTDLERSRPEFAAAIEEDLRWLGLDWDAFGRQSDRLARYGEVADRLRAMGRLYDCYETPEELERKRGLARAAHRPPIYDRAALKLTDADRARLRAEGRRPHWRLKLEPGRVAWLDAIKGSIEVDAASISDPVMIREDGSPLYAFCSVIDDVDFGVSHVIRGEDHVTNTAPQIQLFHALGAVPPTFAHFALLIDAGGEGLSKRTGALSLASLREQGVEPMAVASLIARLGTADPVTPRQRLAELVGGFDLSRFGRAPARFDPAELDHLTAQILHAMDFGDAAARAAALGLAGMEENFWLAVRGNLKRFGDLGDWWHILKEPVDPVIEDAAYLLAARALLPPEPWTEETWNRWIDAAKAATGRKGKALFHPLRLALTGREHGPEMRNLLPLLGRDRAFARLGGERA